MSFLINPYAFLAADGDYESIATVTVGSGGAADIEFTSIPGTYQHLQVRYVARSTASDRYGNVYLDLNSDSGNNYAMHTLYGDGSSAAAAGATSSRYSYLARTGASALTSNFGVAVIDVLDYANTSKNTTMRSISGMDNNATGSSTPDYGVIGLFSGLWMSTNAVTAMKFTPVSGNFVQHSTFALYGIKAP